MNFVKVFFTVLLSLLSLIGVVALQQKEINQSKLDGNNADQEQGNIDRLLLKAQTNIPTLGFSNLWADWNYLKFIQYYGDTKARQETGYSLIPDIFKIIVENDPRFVRAIMVLSTANSIFAASPQITVDLLNQVTQKITPQFDPFSPFMWSYKGVDEMLFLGDSKAAQHSYEMAAEWALKTTDPNREYVAQRNRQTAEFLAANPDSKKARISAWSSIFQGAINEETQKLAIENIQKLGGKVSITPTGEVNIKFPDED